MLKSIIRKKLLKISSYIGPRKEIDNWIQYKNFGRDFNQFVTLSNKTTPRFSIKWEDRYPCLNDDTPTAGFDRHYVYHTAWAARVLAKTKPAHHIDISSHIYFNTLVSAFIPIEFYDYRPVKIKLDNLSSKYADLLTLPFADNSIESLSCMHVVEHIGLGRYGDDLDYEGDLKAIKELNRVLSSNGNLLFVVPIGKPKIIFNAHRIYSFEQIQSYFVGLKLVEFALIPDESEGRDIIFNASNELCNKQIYGCGCFWFRKKDK